MTINALFLTDFSPCEQKIVNPTSNKGIVDFIFFRYVKDGNHLHHLGQKMEDLIFNIADSNFFFNDLEECDQVTNFKSN